MTQEGYGYTSNNPLNLTDPSGLDVEVKMVTSTDWTDTKRDFLSWLNPTICGLFLCEEHLGYQTRDSTFTIYDDERDITYMLTITEKRSSFRAGIGIGFGLGWFPDSTGRTMHDDLGSTGGDVVWWGGRPGACGGDAKSRTFGAIEISLIYDKIFEGELEER